VATTVADPNTAADVPPVREVTFEEGLAMLDRRARRRLGISGAEFLRRWDTGQYVADPEQAGVIEVAMLLPFVGRAPEVGQARQSAPTTRATRR
jgi:hypothetical protein